MSFESSTVLKIWIAISILLLMSLGILLYLQNSERRSHSGLIKVDSPEVYSRERLVNDRYTQRWWLTNQLEKKTINFGNQAVIETHKNLRLSSETRINNNTSTENNDAAKTDLTDEIKPDTPASSPATVTPIDDFRDGLAYREEIRGEIMETLLDDRHDLKGSTLYRLKFDTTLVPRKNNQDWALIEVSFSRGKENPIENDQLYEEWIELTNIQLDSTLNNLARSFLSRNMDDSDHLKFRKYLERKISPKTKIIPVTLEDTIITTSGEKKTLNICDATSDEQIKRQLLCLNKIADIINISYSSYFNAPGNMDMDRLRPLIRSYVCKQDTAHTEHENHSTQELCEIWEGDVLFAFNNIKPIWSKLLPVVTECQNKRGKGDQLSCKQNKMKEDNDFKLVVNLLTELYRRERQFLPLALADYLADEYKTKFSYLMDIQSVNCSPDKEFWDCHLSVTKRKPSCQQGSENCDNNKQNFGAVNFYKQLNCPTSVTLNSNKENDHNNICAPGSDNNLVFAYAITPKESTQRIGELQKNFITLQGIIKIGSQQEGNQISEAAEILKEMRQVAHHINRHPVVVGFSNHHSVEQHHVGWLLGPKFYLSSEGNTIDFRHVPIQNALSALISVPSWWRTMKVSINSCWVRKDSLLIDNLDGMPYCLSNKIKQNKGDSKKAPSYEIRLPGGVDDINRRLGYQIARTPNIKTTNRPHIGEFCANQKNAKLLIEGMDLWRSTAVTLGSQKADRIEVLPNMEAIIATFETIAVPVGKVIGEHGNIFKDVPVVVWTSEGRTITSKSARIHFVGGSCPSKNKKKVMINKPPVIINNFYIGKKDAATISIEGNDFSPDTVVMVGSMEAAIRLIPKGLIATFKKIPVSPENLQQLKIKGKCYIDLPVSVWTFRGKTTPGMIRVFNSAEDYKYWEEKQECEAPKTSELEP